MELNKQIKKYRNKMNLSQEELSEKVYVTRQTISNWENNKNYPDIQSLLRLSTVFNISLDQLIKGNIEIMKDEINKKDLERFNHDGAIFAILLILSTVSVVPLTVFLNYYGLLISAILWGVTMYYALRIEKYKKDNDIQTYKEIVSFTEGKQPDEIEKAKESWNTTIPKNLLSCFMWHDCIYCLCVFLMDFKVIYSVAINYVGSIMETEPTQIGV